MISGRFSHVGIGFIVVAGMLFQGLSSLGQGELPFSFTLPILSSRSMNIITQDFHTTDICGSKYPWFLMQTGSTKVASCRAYARKTHERSILLYLF
ncbi:hypothetical protein V6N11_009252 [Hibiscus sabdariffa]|uniref:Uncharacterized protein n=1 Tax=Hibiscus sabdariffa TaxID=183260 RepID=A0ABR2PQ33_9ROSI